MSGILGLFDPSPVQPLAQTLQDMQSAVLHRGMHGTGLWAEDPIGLAHQLFATTPEARFEKSPQIDADGYVISADVRLDNRDELISQLGLDPENQAQLTDPSLLLAAFRRWGTDCPIHLLGAFAFLIWDPVEQRFFGARDHLGIKPFYYFQQADYFAVASEIKALLRSPQVKGELDPIRIADLLTSQLKDPVRTSFVGISRLPAGHSLWFNLKDSAKTDQYWRLDPNRKIELESDAAYTQRFRDIFLEAVRCRLRAGVPIGAHLSGGMDSSSVAATAEHLRPPNQHPLKTFSATFLSVPECDETSYVKDVLKTGQFAPYFVPADHCGPLTHWETLLDILDEPALGNGYLSLLMNQEAQRQGVHVVLNGYDGDTTIGHGTLYPHELARAGHWNKALDETQRFAEKFKAEGVCSLTLMRRMAFEVLAEFQQDSQWFKIASGILAIYKRLGLSRRNLLKKFLFSSLRQKILVNLGLIKVAKTTSKDHSVHYPHLNQDFLSRYADQLSSHQAQFTSDQRGLTVQQQQINTISSGMMSFPIELLDQVSAPFQIEPRYPMMDKRLVEFCVAIPANQKLRQGWSRYILRHSMEAMLPTSVQWRGAKTNLSKAFQAGLQHYDQAILAEVFQENPERISQFIDLEYLKSAYQSYRHNQTHLNAQWPAITLSLWMKLRQDSSKKKYERN